MIPMDRTEAESIASFFRHVLKLKSLRRTGWVRKGVSDPESVAAHSYGVALLSMVIASREGLDAGKALKMALLHDLPEAVSGDLTPRDKEYKRKRAIEEKSMEAIVSSLPQGLRSEIVALHKEFEDCRTPEAKAVETADKLDMVLTASEYEKAVAGLGEFFELGWASKLTEEGRRMLETFIKQRGTLR